MKKKLSFFPTKKATFNVDISSRHQASIMFVFSSCRHFRFSCLVYLPLMIAVSVFVTFTIGTYITVVDNIADYNVIQNISSVVTYTDCYMRCERNPACTHFVLNKGNHSFPRCSLLMLKNSTNATDSRGSKECKQEVLSLF